MLCHCIGVEHRRHVVAEERDIQDEQRQLHLVERQLEHRVFAREEQPDHPTDEGNHWQRPDDTLARVPGVDLAQAGEQEREKRRDSR